ncbi:MAG: polysaccharide deacetylase family protein [Gemmataceae bacterium]
MTGWKATTRAALSGLYKYSGAMTLHESIAHLVGFRFMTIVLFHRVTDLIPEDGLTVSVDRFRRICTLMAQRFRVVPLGEVFRIARSGEPMPPRTLAITFDDSYRDNLQAAQILAELGLPATFFIPTSFIGSDRTFEWDRDLPAMPNLSWEDVRSMVRLGFEIGSHTVSHANMGVIGPDQARAELTMSRAIIEEQTGARCRWFAYPFGGKHHFRPEYIPMIAETGYDGGVSAFGGFVRPGIDARVLPREALPYFRSLAHLELFLSGCLHWLYALKGRSHETELNAPWNPLTSPVKPLCPLALRELIHGPS